MITAKEAREKSMLCRDMKETMNHIEQAISGAAKLGWSSVRVVIDTSIGVEARKLIISELEALGYRASYNVTYSLLMLVVSW